jgi:hypothetical protein
MGTTYFLLAKPLYILVILDWSYLLWILNEITNIQTIEILSERSYLAASN